MKNINKVDPIERKRQDLKKKLLDSKERENNSGYRINEFGEIIREGSDPPSISNDDIEVVRTLGQFVKSLEFKAIIWKSQKKVIIAFIAALISIFLLPSSISPIYYGRWVFYPVVIWIVLQILGELGRWYSLRDDNENHFDRVNIIGVLIWVFLFILLLVNSEALDGVGICSCMVFIIVAYAYKYHISSYVKKILKILKPI